MLENDTGLAAPSRREFVIGAGLAAAGALGGLPPAPALAAQPQNAKTLKTKDGTEIFYKDWGKGQPIVFHHGWPLSADDWDTQMLSSCNTAIA